MLLPPFCFLLFHASNHIDFALHNDTIQEVVMNEFRSLSSPIRMQAEHGTKEVGQRLCFRPWEQILLVKNIVQRPISQFVDVSKLALIAYMSGL